MCWWQLKLWRKSHLSNWSQFKTSTISLYEKKNRFLFSNISFRSRDIQVFIICKLAKWRHHILDQILIKYDEKRYISQFVSEMFDSLQYDSSTPQYEVQSFVNIATYWVPDLRNIRGISGYLQRAIFIFHNSPVSNSPLPLNKSTDNAFLQG